jgi:hypothetical protein
MNKLTCAAAALMLAIGGAAVAQDGPATTQPAPATVPVPGKPAAPLKLQYRPPNHGAPKVRVSGGVRGSEQQAPTLSVLAPPHVGLTLSGQPTLQWHVDIDTDMTAQITIVRDDALTTVLKQQIAGPLKAGMHSFKLSSTDVTLEPGVVYSWSVALLPAGESRPRSQDPFARAAVQRVAADDPILAAVDAAAPEQKLQTLADRGVWYDVLAAVSASVESDAQAPAPLMARAMLLDQAELKDLANLDRRAAMDRVPADGK